MPALLPVRIRFQTTGFLADRRKRRVSEMQKRYEKVGRASGRVVEVQHTLTRVYQRHSPATAPLKLPVQP